MDPITQQVVLATAGAAAAGEGLYADDVFSTSLYDGNGSTQTITNGIDLSGEGGLVWIKRRDGTHGHRLTDTERGATKALESESDAAEATHSTGLTAFNSDGFSLGSNAKYNGNGYEMCSWSFRKAPGFFDVVTYTGNGTAGRTVSHNLGSVPGMILLKQTSGGSARWFVYHRSTGNGTQLTLNNNNAAFSTSAWNNTTPTSTEFTLNDGSLVNGNGETYVAYLFAHDDQSFGTNSNEAIIKCGSYTGVGSSGLSVDLGFEPQFVLVKSISLSNTSWIIFDMMRSMSHTQQVQIQPNSTSGELIDNSSHGLYATATGFASTTANNFFNNGLGTHTYAYMAIRRPHKPPAAGTDVFKMQATSSSNTSLTSLNAYSDLVLTRKLVSINTAYNSAFVDRLRGNKRILTSGRNTGGEVVYSGTNPDVELIGLEYPIQRIDSESMVFHSFKRAPGFFDIVAYTGNGSARTLSHNLGVSPELLICKKRADNDGGGGGQYAIYHSALGVNKVVQLNVFQSFTSSDYFPNSHTSSAFAVGTQHQVNGNSSTFIAYLFATLDGISKVGSYSGTGSNINVDCGFTAGARFVLIKRTDSTGDWYVYDTTRGIVSGNDPYFLFNSTGVQVTNTDYIDPLNAGFTVTSSAPAALNTSGGTYIFLAIA